VSDRILDVEHELAAALRKVDEQMELLRLCKEENNEKHKDIIWGMGERAKLMERIKRLDETLEAVTDKIDNAWGIYMKFKEAKL
jgi:hypothetical protein